MPGTGALVTSALHMSHASCTHAWLQIALAVVLPRLVCDTRSLFRLQMFSCLRDAFGPMDSMYEAPQPKKSAHQDADSRKKAARPMYSAYQNSIEQAAQASAEGITSFRQ